LSKILVTVLAAAAALATEGRLRPITNTQLHGLSVESMREAHRMLETKHTIGKVVITVD
jgi:hypothetical protein